MTRLAEQHRMAVPWVLDTLEQYARSPMMQKRVTPAGCLGFFRRQVYLDVVLSGQYVTCYETVNGLEAGGPTAGSLCCGSIGAGRIGIGGMVGRGPNDYAVSRIRPLCVRGLLSHHDSEPLQLRCLRIAVMIIHNSSHPWHCYRYKNAWSFSYPSPL